MIVVNRRGISDAEAGHSGARVRQAGTARQKKGEPDGSPEEFVSVCGLKSQTQSHLHLATSIAEGRHATPSRSETGRDLCFRSADEQIVSPGKKLPCPSITP